MVHCQFCTPANVWCSVAVAVDAEGEAFRLMSESCAWIINDESGQHLRKIIEAFPAARKSYVLELKEDLENYVRLLAYSSRSNSQLLTTAPLL